ncbi:histidine-type phosphatase [Gluconacetobacter azotocaptans]|uniref:Histidine-type phosphatase n=1 Tax=Gluconacetobacter azotocaptans TaxID=142834 RepID=A0A7W4PEJ1_9PROT|nr:histidine-type phosphatase [Gluconacetobacter azotocaptans]MBB2191412.1 histidine-type phosphatase [Gluconacetobacter azotocaptans]GBQ27186.1 phosphoanhydride phosphohydrolase [Gluconacetobacter azotocaptans DSM 13594]
MRFSSLLRLTLVVGSTMSGGLSAAQCRTTAAQPVLEKIVLISRHGIRSPTQPVERLREATGRDWPAWPVPPGQLTDHGRADLALMGGFLAHHYQAAGLLPTAGCPRKEEVVVWGDSADDRTRQSGEIMARTLAGGCPTISGSLPAGRHDPMFNAMAAGAATLNRAEIMRELSVVRQRDPEGSATVRQALSTVQAVVAPDGCASGGACFTAALGVDWTHGAPHLSAGLALAATSAENLLLEYLQGMPEEAIAWGRRDVPALLEDIMPAHAYASDMLRRLPAIAYPRGRGLTSAILDILDGNPVTLPDGTVVGGHARLVMFAGHDTTLDMLATIFGLDWHFADQPDRTAPDTTLGLELWRRPDGVQIVKAVIFHQSLAELRNALPLDDTGWGMDLRIASCAQERECPLATLEKGVRAGIAAHAPA